VSAGVPVRRLRDACSAGPPLYHFNGPIGYDSDNCSVVHALDTHENSVDGRVRSRAQTHETMSRNVGRTLSWPGTYTRSVSLGDLYSSEKIWRMR